MQLLPIADKIIIKRVEELKQSAGGIFIPESSNSDKPDRGTVVAVGPGKTMPDGTIRPMVIEAGDQVIFAKNAGHSIKVDGEEFIVAREEDLIARLK